MNIRYPGLIALLVTVGVLAWLNNRPEADLIRWGIGGVIVLFAAGLLWLCGRDIWKPIAVVTGTIVLLSALFLTSPLAHRPIFEEFVGRIFAWLFIAVVSWLFVRILLPKTQAKYQTTGIVMLAAMLSFALLCLSLLWWLKAVDLYTLPKNPVAATSPQIRELWEQPWGKRYRGIFVIGTIGDPKKRSEDPSGRFDSLAYYATPSSTGKSSSTFFPSSYKLRLTDGTIITVQGIDRVQQTYNWPEGGPATWQHCLRHGDPVVIWADPGQLVSASNGQKTPTLTHTRAIAYGTPEEFASGYLTRAVATARVFGWIGLGLVPFSILPLILGLRRRKWLLEHGSDEAPPGGGITIK